jgi:choice-of-anchor A domain-containing protein
MKLEGLQTHTRAGMSLLEVLVVVAGIGILFSAVASTVGGLNRVINEKKLERDVDAINRAIRLYEVSGGSLEGIYPHPWWILGKLKSRVIEDEVDEAAGLTGSMIDPRLQPVLMSASERASGDLRSVWNPTDRKFEILDGPTEPGAHIKAFKLTDDTWIDELVTEYFANNEEARDGGSYKYASANGGVWNYGGDAGRGSRPEPTTIPLSMGFGAATSAGLGAGMIQLDPPTFSIPAGSYELLGFPLTLSLGNPNDPAVSAIFYSIRLGVWVPYDGTPIAVGVDDVVTAVVVSTDRANWADSDFIDSAYDSIPLSLEFRVAATASVNWMEAGGAVEPGGPATSPASPGLISLANAADIPDGYENSSNFLVYWTTDGSDPVSSGTRHQGGPFSGGFGGETVDLALAEWGAQSSLPIQVFGQSQDRDIFMSSEVESTIVTIDATTLRAPILATSAGLVTISTDPSYGDMPVGARIYYTTDGTDPGESGGEPVTGTLYTGPFAVDVSGAAPVGECASGVTVRARVYAPSGCAHWFDASGAGSEMAVGGAPTPGSFAALVCAYQSDLCQYGWFSTGDILSASTPGGIGGDVGIGPGGTSEVTSGTATGTILRDPSASGYADEIRDLSAPLATVLELNLGFGSLSATQSFSDLEDGMTVVATAGDGINVIDAGRVKINSHGVLNFDGGPDDWFVVNVSDRFTLNGNAIIGGTADPSKVLFNILPSVDQVKINGQGNAIAGSILAPTHWLKIQGGGELGGQAFSAGGNLGTNSRVRHDYSFGGCE